MSEGTQKETQHWWLGVTDRTPIIITVALFFVLTATLTFPLYFLRSSVETVQVQGIDPDAKNLSTDLGLQQGDEIVAVNGIKMTSVADLLNKIETRSVDGKIQAVNVEGLRLDFLRGGKLQAIIVHKERLPDSIAPSNRVLPPSEEEKTSFMGFLDGFTELPHCLMDGRWRQLPCRVPKGNDKDSVPLVVDRFSVWDVIAIVQSLLFSLFLFIEGIWHQRADLRLLLFASIVFIYIKAFNQLLYSGLDSRTEYLVMGTLLFVVEDLLIWLRFRHDNTKEPHEVRYSARVLLCVDIPLFLGTLMMWHLVSSAAPYESAEASAFFAGGTAFSLVLANLTIAVLRVFLHKEHKEYINCEWKHYLSIRGRLHVKSSAISNPDGTLPTTMVT